jgi:elongator complex protein 3
LYDRPMEMASAEYHRRLISLILEGEVSDKSELQRRKIELCRELGLSSVPPNSETLRYADDDLLPLLIPMLQRKPVRTLSGVAVVAVMTSPADCPHGKCSYCPGGVVSGSPQSYTGKEPAARRALRNDFDPFRQTTDRIKQLEAIGHRTDKIDLIVMGGTFTARDEEYQVSFAKGCLDAMNELVSEDLEKAQALNETARHRCIGMTVETRPDSFDMERANLAMRLGATRVELGVQILDDEILDGVERGHGVGEVVEATKVAKRLGLKVCYHIMPGLPGSSPQTDLDRFRTIFSDPRFRPDMLKIYPTLVVKGTRLYDQWERGEYEPYSTEQAAEVIASMKAIVPPYVRIQRIQRDIPVPLIEGGVDKGHLRQLVTERLNETGGACRCIRCREVGLMGIDTTGEDAGLDIMEYEASGGREHFISFVLPRDDALVGYARLRIDSEGGAVAHLRELKVFGRMAPLEPGSGEWQHRGFGKRLLEVAESTASEAGCDDILVTSGVGVRRYYASLGYERRGVYMGKRL